MLDPSYSPHVRQAIIDAFTREAHLLASLNTPGHPNIPEIYDFFAESHCLVMKYVVGEDLARVIRRRSAALTLDEVLRIARDVCTALFYLHSRSPVPVLHRDIKPANLLRDSEGRVWLIDFGLAQNEALAAAPASGTPGYAPPEQWRGQALPASDIYALAATIYTLLTARYPPPPERGPFTSSATATPAVPRLLLDAPEALDDLVWRALAVDPAVRPGARECLDVIETLLAQSRIQPPPPPSRPPAMPACIGREAELAALQEQLAATHALILTGIAGIGKTTLAIVLAGHVATPEALFWHRFATGAGAEELIWGLAAFLARRGRGDLWATLQGARQSGGALPPTGMLIDFACALLREDHAEPLLLLDDLHLVEDDPEVRTLCERLVTEARTSTLRLLITSRTLPQFAGSLAVVPLAGLDLPAAQALLEQRGLALSAAYITQLTQVTGGNPQLLALAGEVLRHQSQIDPELIMAQLAVSSDVEHYLLQEVDITLSERERTAMRAVATLFDGGGTRDAVEAILDADTQRELRDLAVRGLLTVAEGRRERVYGQHAILQSYFYQQIGRRERRRLHRRAAAFYDEEEPAALRAALHYERAAEAERAAEIVTRNAWTIVGTGQARPLRTLLESLREADLVPPLRARLLIACGDVESLAGESESARRSYDHALATLSAEDDSPGMRVLRAQACRGIGRLLEVSLPREALAWLTRGQADLAGADAIEEAEICNKIGGVQIRLGDLAAADRALAQAETLAPPGPSQLRVNVLQTLGMLYSTRGDITRGMQSAHAAVAVCDQLHDPIRASQILNNLALDRIYRGDIVGAQSDLRRTLEFAIRIGNRQLQLAVLLNLGLAGLRTGDLGAAEAVLGEALQLAQDLHAHVWKVATQCNLADLALRQGHLAKADQILAAGEALALKSGAAAALPELTRLRAELTFMQGDLPTTITAARQSLALATEQQNDAEAGNALHILGRALHAGGLLVEALDSFAQAVQLLDGSDAYEAARTRLAWAAALEPSDPAAAAALRAAGLAELARQGAALS